jgi:hypothetical protein
MQLYACIVASETQGQPVFLCCVGVHVYYIVQPVLLLLPLQAPDVLVNDLTLNSLLELRPATQEQVGGESPCNWYLWAWCFSYNSRQL